MKKISATLFLLCALSGCGDSDDEKKDMEKPVITDLGVEACPQDCQSFKRGEEMQFCYLFTDDVELGSYNIEVHNNFDHHTHSTSAVECPMEDKKSPVNPWIYNEDYAIPAGSTHYEAHQFITVPEDVDCGTYHFVIRVTDQAGWQQIRSVSIRIE